jgi:hypothetical protein
MERSLRLLAAAVLICGAGYAPNDAAWADERSERLQLVAYGKLERFTDSEGVRYALLDEDGNAIYQVSPQGRVDFKNYFGEVVRVVGSLHSGSEADLREIRVQTVEPADKVVPAHFVQVAEQRRPRNESNDRSDDISDSAPELPLEPLPEQESPPDFPGFSDAPPLINEPMINEGEAIIQDGPIFDSGDVYDDGGVTLQAPTTLPPDDDFDAYQSLEQQTGACGPRHWIWGNVEYLWWRTKGTYIPPLVTTSPPGTPQVDAGVLGRPGTSILFGDGDLFDTGRDGSRWVIGSWFGRKRRLGWEFEYLGLADEASTYSNASNGVDIIARPFTNVDPNLGAMQGPDSELISYLNVIAGGIHVDTMNRFYTIGVHLRGNIRYRNGHFYDSQADCATQGSGYRLDLLGGYRYQLLQDDIAIGTLTSVSVTPQGGFDVFDRFQTQNNFSGGELGLLYQYYRNRWTVDGVLKFALGRTEQKVTISGGTDLTTVGIETPFEGGLLALPTNIGSYSRKKTDLIPEFGITGGYYLNRNLRVTCSYRLIYWPKTVRAADQMDLTVNGSYIPDPTIEPSGPPLPEFTFVDTSYWAQGLSFGVDYRW